MVPVLLSSPSNVSLPLGSPFISQNDNLTRFGVFRKSSKQVLPTQRYILPLSISVRLFPHFRSVYGFQPPLRLTTACATGIDVALEEASSTTEGNDATVAVEASPDSVDNEEASSKSDAGTTATQAKRTRSVRKSEMPPVKNEQLIAGTTFTGKVRSIQPFGAFVDFGAFTDGLVHVSQLTDSFVKDVNNVVSVGQEVTVRLVEANMETGRISLTMRESDDSSANGEKPRTPRKNNQRSDQKRGEPQKTSKFVKGQELQGTVKNLTRSGAFISLPEGEEGFLPASEESDGGLGNIMGSSSLQAGEEVKVRVLRINRGKITVTMKSEEDAAEFDKGISRGVVHTATNPFVLAFRGNEDISTFLDKNIEDEATRKLEQEKSVVTDTRNEAIENNEDPESTISDSSQEASAEALNIEKGNVEVESKEDEAEVSSELIENEGSRSAVDQIPVVSSVVAVDNNGESSTSESLISEELPEKQSDDVITKDADQATSSAEEIEVSSTTQVELELEENPDAVAKDVAETGIPDEKEEVSSTTNTGIPDEQSDVISNDAVQTDILDEEKVVSSAEQDGQEEEEVSSTEKTDIPDEQPVVISNDTVHNEIFNEEKKEVSSVSQDDQEANGSSISTSGQIEVPESLSKATISPQLVKQLREESGAGMMDCKKALSETGGDIIKAQEYLRKKGLASADKKASRATAEGRIGSYIHDSRIGVLIEVNCETDFVSRGEIFKELVDDLAMQVAACPQVQYLGIEDVPQDIIDKEREIEMQKEDLASKPEQFRSKIVDGRIRKRLEELALLEQPYIKNDKVAIRDFVKQTIATIGENIKVKRFIRYNLGEGLEKKSQDFAAEVAAQTAAKPLSTSTKELSPAVDDKEAAEKAPKVAVSAALVKQLREETGAGMMDCKKALSETGGNLEEAQAYLRKKGLSAADKKSSRLAAEGRIGAYIHDSRIGVLIEVNCETDFVGRSEKFKELVDDLAMQVVACPQVQYVSVEDISKSTIDREKELEMQREDLQSKPENIREKIVEGRVSKRLGELALLEQSFIKDDSILVKDFIKQTVASIGENIKVRRFVRFTLGESSDQEAPSEAQVEQQ
ncbi:translation elongation factor [Lithospermum erythrorhizon]|uniref:Elongation factor Ts, mitochondrial n=1 Tax=Lithospermum erythrorhizon TaxID=34254 RepID=A0AAV3RYC0_LITER